MSRYDDINHYFYSENNIHMDTERYLILLTDSYDMYLDDIRDNPNELYITSKIFFERVSPGQMYYYMWELVFEKKINNQMLCNFIAFESMYLFIEYTSHSGHIDNFKETLSRQGCALLAFISCHKNDITAYCSPFIFDKLKNKNNIHKDDSAIQKLGILAIEMLASEHNQTIDWDSMGIPFDHFYRDFVKEVLYSTDEKVLTDWLNALCDNHLKWSARSELIENESPLLGYEISEDYQLLWPFEYQAVKNFRAKHGLSTPEIDHPLLNTPMAIDHHPDFSQWQAPEWFYPLLDKLIAINPKITFVRDLFK
ncbi:hypothetical protein [Pectobacterium wasabiae]|nr:hypothetical protein [Pectobacterium wasabiae]AOR62481.1 hypothetical protein A7983_04185 [Pectobacterium wasabiae CFBP 3304]